jgi:HEAT repeat protein
MERLRPLVLLLVGGVCLTRGALLSAAASGEPAITVKGAEGDYLRKVHARIHEHWTKMVAAMPPATAKGAAPDPASARSSEVFFTVRWDGTVAGVGLVGSSGSPLVDQGATAVVRMAGPYGVPPLETFSDDGFVHLRWNFSRGHTLCGDASLRRKEDPLEEAMPRLFAQGRIKEALLRVARHRRAGARGDVVGMFAREWLARPQLDPAADATAAAALAKTGDRRQIDRLRAALARRESVTIAVAGLRSLKVEICGAVNDLLRDGKAGTNELAVMALRAADSSSERVRCADTLAVIAGDRATPPAVRASALELAAEAAPDGARALLTEAAKDKETLVRAAAVLASSRPGGGKVALYRLAPLLRDPAPEMRAAAAAGLVRAGGDQFLEHVIPVVKQRNPRVTVAVALELGRLSSQPSAQLLGTMLAGADAETRVALVKVLAARQDAAAQAVLAPVLEAAKQDPYAPPPVRALALSDADPVEIAPQAADPEVAAHAFAAMVQRGQHQQASDLLMASFDRVGPEQMAAMMEAWLQNPPPASVAAGKRAPALEPAPASASAHGSVREDEAGIK